MGPDFAGSDRQDSGTEGRPFFNDEIALTGLENGTHANADTSGDLDASTGRCLEDDSRGDRGTLINGDIATHINIGIPIGLQWRQIHGEWNL
jgi:hypothetical protein